MVESWRWATTEDASCAETRRVSSRVSLVPPAQSGGLVRTQMEQVQKTLRALNIVDDMTNVGPSRQKRIECPNQFILIFKEALAGLRARAASRCPWPDAKHVVALSEVLAERAEEMDEIAARTGRLGSARRFGHSLA